MAHTEPNNLVSIIITTRNEERNIVPCLRSLKAQSWPAIEIVVVDNASTDQTKSLARQYTEKVFEKGPERSAQRNFGMIEISRAPFVMYVDADMILAPRLVERCVEQMADPSLVALHVPEIVLGASFWGCVRRFERSFYDGTVIDGARFFRRDSFRQVGGFDESINGPEDWDLDKRLKRIGRMGQVPFREPDRPTVSWPLIEFIQNRGVNPQDHGAVLYHNEAEFHLGSYLRKKKYYTLGFDRYVAKWGAKDPDLRLQFGWRYRYVGVFCERGNWKKLLRHPFLAWGMYVLRGLVGGVYLFSQMDKPIRRLRGGASC